MRSSRLSRTLRGAVAAGLATFVALLSHVTAGGAVPGFWGIAVPLLLSTLVCVLLAGRRLSIVRLSAAVAISQLLFHTLFVLGASGTVSGAAAGHAGHAGHGGLGTATTGPLLLTADPSSLAAGVLPACGMWLAHGIAAAVTIAALHRGERALRSLVDQATLIVVRVCAVLDVRVTPPAPLRRRAHAVRLTVPAPTRVFGSAISHRGPPAPVLAGA
ncbi:MAG: hypothetical protein ACTJHU_09090 [Mycetocola sp.]